MTSDVLTVKEAADLLKVSEETIREKARRGELPAIKCGGWRFLRADLLGMFRCASAGPAIIVGEGKHSRR